MDTNFPTKLYISILTNVWSKRNTPSRAGMAVEERPRGWGRRRVWPTAWPIAALSDCGGDESDDDVAILK